MRKNPGSATTIYIRDEELKSHAERIKIATAKPGVKKAFAFYNNHARANAAANAIMLSQELGVRLNAMPAEAMVTKFPDMAAAAGRYEATRSC